MTATPRNKSAWDIYHQLKLFHQDDKTDLPIDPPNLKEYFQLVKKGAKKLPELLSHMLIRRTRNHILRFYGFDSKTEGQRYILRELRIFFKSTTDEEIKGQVNILEKAFRWSVNQAVNRELNKLRRDGFTGKELFNNLVQQGKSKK